MDSREFIESLGDRNPCRMLITTIYIDEYKKALLRLNEIMVELFKERPESKQGRKTKFIFAHHIYSYPCSIIETTYEVWSKDSDEYMSDETALVADYPIRKKFRIDEVDLCRFIKEHNNLKVYEQE